MIRLLIKKTPRFIQSPIRYLYYSIPDYYRLGKVFRKTYRMLDDLEYSNEESIKRYQLVKILNLLIHAYETVPYYHDLFNEKGIDVYKITSFEDFQNKIPFLTKQDIQENINSMLSSEFKKSEIEYSNTGGSTGTPMGFYVNKKEDRAIERAFTTHIWRRVGYNVKKLNKMVTIRGNVPQNGVYEFRNKELVLSSYSLSDENIIKYLNLIEKFNPDFIQAYPSSIIIIADYILKHHINIKFKKLKAILCASENLYDFQRERIYKAFNVKPFSFYGHSEHCSIAGECESKEYYHIESLYGYTEIINNQGEQIDGEGKSGEIISTSLNNYVMPLIRYKTGDIAVNTNNKCKCGRQHKLIKKIEGRIQEQIVINDGSKVAMTSLIFSQHFKAFGKMKNIQLEQNEIGKVKVRIIEKEKFTDEDIHEIITKMETACNNKLTVTLEFVDEIKRTERGKQKMLIQNLKD